MQFTCDYAEIATVCCVMQPAAELTQSVNEIPCEDELCAAH